MDNPDGSGRLLNDETTEIFYGSAVFGRSDGFEISNGFHNLDRLYRLNRLHKLNRFHKLSNFKIFHILTAPFFFLQLSV